MFSEERPKRFTEKGLGWIPDSPDERDRDLYQEISRRYFSDDSNRSLKRVHQILSNINNLNFKDKQELDNLAQDLEKFEFIKVNTYQILAEDDEDRRVVLLKFLMVYFYQMLLRAAKNSDSTPEKVAADAALAVIEPKLNSGDAKKYFEVKESLDFKDAGYYWTWLNDEKYDSVLSALVHGFQSWINHFYYTPRVDKEKNSGILVDGIVGVQTYTWLREWLTLDYQQSVSKDKRVDTEKQNRTQAFPRDTGTFKDTVFSRVPFSTAFPSDMLKEIIELLDKEKGSKQLINVKNIDLRVERLAQENFFEIEPFLSIITLISGPVEAYPKTFKSALKMATKLLFFLLEKDYDYLDDEISFNFALKDKKPKHFAFLLAKTVQLPTGNFIELEEERKNFHYLSKLAKASLTLCKERIKRYLNEIFSRDLQIHQEYLSAVIETSTDLKDSDLTLKQESIYDEFQQNLLELQEICDSAHFLGRIHEVFLSLSYSETDDSIAHRLVVVYILSNEVKQVLKEVDSYPFLNDSGGHKAIKQLIERLSSLINPLLSSLEFDQFIFYEKEYDFRDLVTLELVDDSSSSDLMYRLSEQMNWLGDGSTDNSSEKRNTSEINKLLFPSYLVPSGADLLKNRKTAQKRAKSAESQENQQHTTRTYTYLPQIVDLSLWCSPVKDQGSLKSCCAHAGTALVEYFVRRYGGGNCEVSRKFLYKIARNLMGRTGDSGASLRDTIKAMTLFGVPPEKYWRYETANFDDEPTPFCYSFAQNYQTLNYFRIDQPEVAGDELLTRIKITLAAGFPCAFGFTLHESVYDPFNVERGYIPYPGRSAGSLAKPDAPVGGHVVLAVGYHDFKRIMHSTHSENLSRGAILIKNSWGTGWGLNGYGWLPYDYVRQRLTSDWWSLSKLEWLESGKFGLGGARDFGTGSTGQLK
ncbi:MAG: C1 family peptidase [Leptolyngbya sp. SIO1D8]|nr:C1 family peptidase [Leptolyngbya sp. SIO1D8]